VHWASWWGFPLLLGGVLGLLSGVIVWAAAGLLSAWRSPQSSGSGERIGWAAIWQSHGAVSVGSCLTQGAMTLLGAYVMGRTTSLAHLLGALWVTGVLLAVSIVDFRVRRIPNALFWALLLWAPLQVLLLGYPSLANAGLGLLVGGGVFLVLALIRRGAMGAGDVKLVAALGAILGFPSVFYGLLLGAVLGGAAALFLLASRRAGRKDPMAYGPYLALGGWVVWTQVMGLWPWVTGLGR